MSFHNHKLPNYLRTYRKRAGLFQDDVAVLLGTHGEARMCRYEHFRGQPTLRTALALEAIFRVPIRELFAGQYQQVEREVYRRAEELANTLRAAPEARATARRLEALRKITGPSENP